MPRNLYLLLLLWLWAGSLAAQTTTGEIKGRVTDAETGEELPFANVQLLQGNTQVDGVQTDLDGYYKFSGRTPGQYDIKVTYVGYSPKRVSDVLVKSDKTIFQNIKLGAGNVLDEVVVVDYKVPLVEQDQTSSGTTLSSEDVQNIATRSVNQIAATGAGAYSGSDGVNFRGSRDEGTVYIVDGVRVRDISSVPQGNIEQVATINGGVPARYGDVTGGVISITTKGGLTDQYGGSFEAITSTGLDPYDYNVLEATFQGPLLQQYKGTDSAQTKMAFAISANTNYRGDQDPSAVGVPQLKDATFDRIRAEPLVRAPGGAGFVNSGQLVRADEINTVDAHPNNERYNYNLNAKVDYKLGDGLKLTGGFQYGNNIRDELGAGLSGFNSNYNDLLFNYNNFSERQDEDYRGFLRFSQNFETEKGSAIENANYQVQVDYSVEKVERRDGDHGENYFRYGHSGYFERYQGEVYEPITQEEPLTITTQNGEERTLYSGRVLVDTRDDSIGYRPSPYNGDLSSYNNQFFREVEGNVLTRDNVGNVNPSLRDADNLDLFLTGVGNNGGVINGRDPGNVYSTWTGYGEAYPFYVKQRLDQLSVQANASATIGDHEISFGVQYEQRTSRSFNVNGPALWQQMRLLANRHIEAYDQEAVAIIDSTSNLNGDPTVVFPRRVSIDEQSSFDANLRSQLIAEGAVDSRGNPVTETSIINIDRYDPDRFSLDLFAPDELVNNGRGLVNYNGYDYTGSRQVGQQSFDEFLDNEGERPVSPFTPIYVAGYVQDKFTFRDLIFRIGVRVDRYDANRQVLKDRYSLFPVKTVADLRNDPTNQLDLSNLPDNIEEDYVVYVDYTNDITNPSSVVGYRQDDQFFDAEGNAVSSPQTELNPGGGLFGPAAFIEDPNAKLSTEAFEDYEPQTNVLPRISFSFPISENSNFFANYDVLTQRPSGRNQATIQDYFYLFENSTNFISNPALNPERRTNYEVGFKQKLSQNSALTLQSFYGEIRDMIQIQRVNGAFLSQGSPLRGYTTFSNIDFGTIKGFTGTYDLRRNPNTGNKNLKLKISYTLQFADGTGSNTTTQQALIQADQPNLRVLNPLSFDVRHNIVSTFDFRYLEGKAYNGPIINGTKILKNTGLNMIIGAVSGEPYSAQSNPTQSASFGIQQRTFLEGDINGSRKPWRLNVDAKLDKRISVNVGGTDEGGKAKELNLRFYLWVLNVFDANNVRRVFRYTGQPEDDGFLTSEEGQQIINTAEDPQSFRDLYRAKLNNFGRFTAPRRIRIGASVLF